MEFFNKYSIKPCATLKFVPLMVKFMFLEAVQMIKRERELIRLLSKVMSNKEIGQRIRVSAYTVKSHIHNIMDKLALHTRLEIANYFYSDETFKTITKSISMVNN